jgi:hypothetical integral membrane protein (TIGR02206 family)
MEQFFTKEFSAGPFVLFSPQHVIVITIIILINVSFLYLRNIKDPRFQQKFRRGFRITLAVLLLANETMWHIWNIVTHQWTIQTMLPLHLCSVFVFLSAYMLLTGDYRVYEFAYFLGIGGALQPILTPDLGIYAFPHFRFFQVFLSHGGIVTAAIFMTVVEGYRPTWKSLGRTILYMNIYMVTVGLINALIGSNYLFIAHKPETASLIDVLGPWPWYLLALEGIGLVLFTLLYVPFAIRDFRDRRMIPGETA